ncbi:MAG: aldo/keto reductase, partial [Candidatus Humimicrobiaceae bacterium]
SLKKLKTDYFDLYQFHNVITLEEVKELMGPGGAIEAAQEAKEKGQIRYIGFSAHTEEAAIALIDQYEFSSILFPLNWASWFKNDFGPKVLKKAELKNLAILALKALAKRSLDKNEKPKWPKCWYVPIDEHEEASLALRFTLSMPVTSAVSPSHAELLWLACDIADNYKPITEEETEFLRGKSKDTNTLTELFRTL